MIVRRIIEHREARGLSQGALARFIGYPQPYLSAIETGKRTLTDGVAEALDKHLGTHGEFVALLEMARKLLIEPGAREIVSQETKAERIRVFTSSVIPGLLQTEDYARDLFRKGLPRDSDEEIEEKVTERIRRHSRVFEKADPPFYRAVVDESALARPASSNKVMAAQLRAILSYQNQPRIKVAVLPFGARVHGMQGGSLVLLDLADGGTVALVESFRTGQAIETPRIVVEYEELFETVQSQALSAEESNALITKYLKEYADEASE
ncbi:Helix-turn-helix [Streptomyces aidingensis]|uniref:Helix-turn-helix n=2 Tax=Streptomyces aidingensis TaxID=910347 RepID=A0A1I1TMG3_9ACTN|nr:Helix-turn-helix [Streptomyces aidingensis]